MLDLIIPVYKNKAGLYRSLFSIGTETNKEVFVTIVDDCSGDTYEDVIEIFQKFFPIRVIYLPENKGPGIARQTGLDAATQSYVAFLDCGDTYITPTKLMECLRHAKANPQYYFLSWGHIEEHYNDGQFSYSDVNSVHNRLHGKMYRRDFLKNHNICFSAESSRANEDIGFNISVRLIATTLSRKDGVDRIYSDDTPAVVWKSTGPSIVRSNNYAFYYEKQNMGMAINGEHILRLARQNNVDEDLILEEIYEEMVHMYIFYNATLIDRPEFLDKAIAGAARYYHNCFREVGENDLTLLNRVYWTILTSFLSDPNEPIRKQFTILDFPQFLNMLETYDVDSVSNLFQESENNDDGFTYKEL